VWLLPREKESKGADANLSGKEERLCGDYTPVRENQKIMKNTTKKRIPNERFN
jgi:hypothetical protein